MRVKYAFSYLLGLDAGEAQSCRSTSSNLISSLHKPRSLRSPSAVFEALYCHKNRNRKPRAAVLLSPANVLQAFSSHRNNDHSSSNIFQVPIPSSLFQMRIRKRETNRSRRYNLSGAEALPLPARNYVDKSREPRRHPAFTTGR
jgi:hypothetical protein